MMATPPHIPPMPAGTKEFTMNERAQRITSDGLTLEAILHLPERPPPLAGVVVCHPHPQYGGDMDNNVVMAVCAALAGRGIAALRFNYRGVGRSDGAFDGGRGEARDTVAALQHLAALPEIDGGRTALAGYSFGAAMAQASAVEGADALALISPPVRLVNFARLDGFEGPLLLVTGDADPVSPEESLRTLAASLPRAEAHVVPGADHSWWGHERALSDLAGAFFARHLVSRGSTS
jgi:alpha/beta superfamily hydrolase